MNNCKIAVFAADFGMNTNPSLMALFEALQAEGAAIDFYCSANLGGQSPESVLEDQLGMYRFPYYLNLDDSSVRNFARSLSLSFTKDQASSWRRSRSQSYDLVIGIDDFGVVAASPVAKKSSCPLVFLSYEILFAGELKTRAEKRLKRGAIAANPQISLAIVQDKYRAKNLLKENKLEDIPTLMLPVSPAKEPAQLKNTQYLREKFDIPADKTILLHSGSFADWTAAPDLIAALPDLSDDVVLVIHTRWNATVRSNPFIDSLKQSNFPNVILSLDAVNELEYAEMVRSADIGLVLYSHGDISENIREIGFASGKFAAYTRAALPVITWNHPFYKDLFNSFQCGVDVKNLSDITVAAHQISHQYDRYAAESARLFSEKLDFSLYWPQIKSAFEALTAQPTASIPLIKEHEFA